MNAIDFATVVTVYSGKPGCACGCRGRYFVTPASEPIAAKRRGYPAFPEDIKEREVRRIVRLLNASPDTKKFGGSEEDIYELEVGGRVYRAYCTRANTPQEARS